MFWDQVARLYDISETIFNGKVNKALCLKITDYIDENDVVLECACGTGMLSKAIGEKCAKLLSTDFSKKMLIQARKKCQNMDNVHFRNANILNLKCKNNSFDKVVAGNVIHLLDEPYKALEELIHACKSGGEVIIPTYITKNLSSISSFTVKVYNKLGADFKQLFTANSYREFFEKGGYTNVSYDFIDGKMPCCIAVIKKN